MSTVNAFEFALNSFLIACLTLILFTLIGRYFLALLGVEFYSFRIVEERSISELIITPLAIPLLTGPGAMTASLAFYTLSDTFFLKIALIFNILLGKSGTILILRIMGLVLSAIAVQFIIQGIKEAGVIA